MYFNIIITKIAILISNYYSSLYTHIPPPIELASPLKLVQERAYYQGFHRSCNDMELLVQNKLSRLSGNTRSNDVWPLVHQQTKQVFINLVGWGWGLL